MFEGLKIYSVWIAAAIVWCLLIKEVFSYIRLSKFKKNLQGLTPSASKTVATDLLNSGEAVLLVRNAKLNPFKVYSLKIRKLLFNNYNRMKSRLITRPSQNINVFFNKLTKYSVHQVSYFIGRIFDLAQSLRFRLRFQLRKIKFDIKSKVGRLKIVFGEVVSNTVAGAKAAIVASFDVLLFKPIGLVAQSFKNVFEGILIRFPVFLIRSFALTVLGVYSASKRLFARPKKNLVRLIAAAEPLVRLVFKKAGLFVFRVFAIAVMTALYPLKQFMDWADVKFESLISQYKNEEIQNLELAEIDHGSDEYAIEEMVLAEEPSLDFRMSDQFIIEESLENFNVVSSNDEITSLKEMDHFISNINPRKSILVMSELEGFSEHYPSINFEFSDFNLESVLVKNYSNNCDLIVNCRDLETALEIYNELKGSYSSFYFLRNQTQAKSFLATKEGEERDARL
ncbi:MAG: hypothetical protein VX642_01860 [Bdellovibrionota bacterium]|nr:hypothetical protein [Bdellovibrionota bacterium]